MRKIMAIALMLGIAGMTSACSTLVGAGVGGAAGAGVAAATKGDVKKGAAVGTAAGAGAGGAVVMSTRGEEVRLSQGTKVSIKLTEPLVVKVPAH